MIIGAVTVIVWLAGFRRDRPRFISAARDRTLACLAKRRQQSDAGTLCKSGRALSFRAAVEATWA